MSDAVAPSLPEGRYLSCAFAVDPDAGGQTRALLMRNRILEAEGGVRPTVLSFFAVADLAERRRLLLERGLLTEGIGLLNVYEHHRDHGWGERAPAGHGLEDLRAHRSAEQHLADGTPWRIKYEVPGERQPTFDYLRPDGTPFLRTGRVDLKRPASWRRPVLPVAPSGEVLKPFPSVGRFFRAWLRDLGAGAPRVFVFVDSRFLMPLLTPLRGRRLHLLYTMHNMHLLPPRRWDSPVDAVYARVLERIGDLDAMVTLTQRQGEDIGERRGRTSNLFVVPNPIEMPPAPPDRPPRDPHRAAIVARLVEQKGLPDAIAAFERVLQAVPSARLDVYGDGTLREALQAEIDRRGLGGAITLRGFDPRAGDALRTASAFLMTSGWEGYPLSTLESMSRGCPVVSYDCKYGPREQVADGVNGFLVAPGDVERFAERVIELLRSPELVRRMSEEALRTARRHGARECLDAWAGVLDAVVAGERERVRIDDAGVEVTRLHRGRRLRLDAVLGVRGRSARSTLDDAEVTLDAIDRASGAVTRLPLRVRRRGDALRLRARARDPGGDLRLRVVWRNAAWETPLPPQR